MQFSFQFETKFETLYSMKTKNVQQQWILVQNGKVSNDNDVVAMVDRKKKYSWWKRWQHAKKKNLAIFNRYKMTLQVDHQNKAYAKVGMARRNV